MPVAVAIQPYRNVIIFSRAGIPRRIAQRRGNKVIDALPVVDPRSAKEIMDDFYDENGLPK